MKRVTPETNIMAMIKERRANLGLSQAQASKIGGVDPGTWSKAENKSADKITFKLVVRMLKGVGLNLNATIDDLPETPDESDGTLFRV